MPGQSRIRLQESRNINALPYRRTTNNSCQLQPANQLDSFLAQQLAQTDQKKRRKTIVSI